MVDLFRGLITDEGISKVRDITTTQGWKIAPYQFLLTAETQGEFSVSRTTSSMKSAWHTGYFSNVEKLDNNKILLTINLVGTESTIARNINEIYITATTTTGSQPFLYALIQPTSTIVFQPDVGMEMSFILTLTNTNKADIYTIEYVDQSKLDNYQLKREKGQPSGYAPLGADGIVPDDYLPLRDNLPIGTVIPVMCTENYIPAGYLPCDGLEYSYADFQSFYTDYLLAGLVSSCSYQEYQAEINAHGSCGKFALDTEKARFKVPYIANGTHIQQALTEGELSKLYDAGLPNITGTVKGDEFPDEIIGDGCFTDAGSTYRDTAYGSQAASRILGFDASRSNSIYGNSDTVQTKAVALRYFVIIAHGLVGATLADWNEWLKNLTTFYRYSTEGTLHRRNVVFCDSLDKDLTSREVIEEAPEDALWLYSTPVFPYVPMSTQNSGTSYNFPNGGMVMATSPMNVTVGAGELSPITFTNFVGILPVSMGTSVTTSATAYFVGY